jgi:phage shock protein E
MRRSIYKDEREKQQEETMMNNQATAIINITPAQGKAMMAEDQSTILVDVRTEEEYVEGHIPGAILLPVDELEDLAPIRIPDKGATYIVYCRTGNRSAIAARILIHLGYQKVYDMGGIVDWPYETVSGN